MNAGSPGQEWFDVRPVAPGVTAIAEPFHLQCVISYLIEGSERAILLDTGMGVGDISTVVRGLTSKPVEVVNSHSHWDHIGANWRFDEIAIHEAEADWLPLGVSNDELRPWFGPDQLTAPPPLPFDLDLFSIPPSVATRLLRGGETLDLGDRQLDVLHAPGHSPGGIVLVDEAAGWLYSTDVAYPSTLYAFGDEVDLEAYRRSLRMLAELASSLRGVSGSHDGIFMEPAMLVAMADALDAIDAGRLPDERRADRDVHRFGRFSVYSPPTRDREQGTA